MSGQGRARGVRFPDRHARPDGGGLQAARVADARARPRRLHDLDPGGVDPLTCGPPSFSARLRLENHTLKRALTDPRLFSGIGNAYSDEILHAARLSPLQLTRHLDDDDVERLHRATVDTLASWIERLRSEVGRRSPRR